MWLVLALIRLRLQFETIAVFVAIALSRVVDLIVVRSTTMDSLRRCDAVECRTLLDFLFL